MRWVGWWWIHSLVSLQLSKCLLRIFLGIPESRGAFLKHKLTKNLFHPMFCLFSLLNRKMEMQVSSTVLDNCKYINSNPTVIYTPCSPATFLWDCTIQTWKHWVVTVGSSQYGLRNQDTRESLFLMKWPLKHTPPHTHEGELLFNGLVPLQKGALVRSAAAAASQARPPARRGWSLLLPAVSSRTPPHAPPHLGAAGADRRALTGGPLALQGPGGHLCNTCARAAATSGLRLGAGPGAWARHVRGCLSAWYRASLLVLYLQTLFVTQFILDCRIIFFSPP